MCVAVVTQRAKRMRAIILSSVSCLALPYFSTLFHTWHDLRKKNFIEHKMCFDFLYNFCLNTTRSKKNGARYYHKGTQVFM